MYFLIALLPVCIIAVSSSKIFRRSVCETFTPSLLFAALVTYLSGILGILAIGPFIVGALAIGLLCVLLFRARNSAGNLNAEPVFSLGLILIFVGTLCILFFTRGRMVTDMDSFEQWAYVVKKMYLTGSLRAGIGQYASTALYPPGMALIQYYFMRFSPSFDESLLFAAKNIFVLSLFLPFFQKIHKKQWKNALLIGLIALFLPFIEYSTFDTSLEVDAILGLIFGWILIRGYQAEKMDAFAMVTFALGGFFLALTKISGMVFVCIAAVIVFFSRLWNRKYVPAENQSGSTRRYLLSAAILLIAGALGFFSWYLFVRTGSGSDSSASALSLTGGLQQYQKETLVNFMNALFDKDGSGLAGLSPVAWLFAVPLLGAVGAGFISREKTNAKRVVPFALFACLGYFVWLGSLLIGYLTAFIPQEAVMLAAFSRYLSSYQIGVLLFVVYWLLDAITTWDETTGRRILALFVCLLALVTPLDHFFFATIGSPYQNDKSVEFRARYAPSSRYYEKLTSPDIKICYLDQTEQEPGYSFALFQFEALPVDVEKAVAWRLGGPYYDADYYSESPTVDEWEQTLIDGKFTHLYLRNVNAYFKQTYGSLFADPNEIQAGSYYSITLLAGHLQFVRIPT